MFEDRTLSYAALDAHANRLAHHLRARRRAGYVVGLCVERSLEMVVGLFGIFKAGAAYLPLDPNYPRERSPTCWRRGARVVLTQPLCRRAAAARRRTSASLNVDDLMRRDATLDAPIEVDARQLAYLIYTSGSTGKPKGAGNTHGALANRIAWMQDAYRLTKDDVVLHKTPFGFDVSVWEFVWPLATGAKLAIAAPGDHRDPARLVAAIRRSA